MLHSSTNETKSSFILPTLHYIQEMSKIFYKKMLPCNMRTLQSAFAYSKCTHAALIQHRLYRVLFKKKFADFTDVRVKKKSRFCRVVNGILLQQHLLLHLNWVLIHLSNLCFLSISLLQLSKLIETLNKQVEAKGKEINEYREKYGIRVRGEQAPEQAAEDKKSSSTQGVLVAPSTMESVD